MKKYEKGSITLLVVVFIVLCLIGGGVYFVSQKDGEKTESTVVDLNLHTDTGLGISFKVSEGEVVTKNGDQTIVGKSGVYVGQAIVIKKVSGSSVTDSNGKFGNITYIFTNNQLMVSQSDERNGGMTAFSPVDTSRASTTKSGNLILRGATANMGWGRYTYIVVLSNNEFLIVEGPDETINEFVSSIQAVK